VRKLYEAAAETVLKPDRVDKLVKSGRWTLAELEETAAAFRQLAENPDAFFAQARCKAVGWNA
jgi:hypothetical protein